MFFLCGNIASNSSSTDDVYNVCTLTFQHSITKVAIKRGDVCGSTVLARVNAVIDLPAEEAIYHQLCSANFRTSRDVPQRYTNEDIPKKRKSSGRPVDEARQLAFHRVLDWFENSELEIISIKMLCLKMQEYLDDCKDAYSFKHMKSKLEEHYKDEIVINSSHRQETTQSHNTDNCQCMRHPFRASLEIVYERPVLLTIT